MERHYAWRVMFAIVTIGGFQEMVSEGDVLHVPAMDSDVGATVTIDEVLLLSDGKSTTTGTPLVAGASVQLKVLSHGKDDKIRVFKMARRKRFRRVHGHRQHYTEVEVTKIANKK